MKSGNLICSKFLHNWDRASRIKRPSAQTNANHSFGDFDIINILYNILQQYIKMNNWDRVSRIKSPVVQKIANHSSGDFEL